MGVIFGFMFIIAFAIILLAIFLILSVLIIVFQGIGIMKMHKNLNIKGGWMAFVPILNIYAFGKVAEQHVGKNGKKAPKFSLILLLGLLFGSLITILLYTLLLMSSEQSEIIFGTCLVITLLFSTLISLFYNVTKYIALWNIFAIFLTKNITLNMVLSIIFPIFQPFAIFVIRDNEPINSQIATDEFVEQVANIEEISIL